MPGDYAAKAAKIATDKVAPALDRQIAELEAHRKRATSDAGVWKLPRGDEYYAWALARRHDDANDAGADSHDGPGRAARAAVRDGRHPEEAGPDAGHGRRAHDRARQGPALPLRRQRRRPREGHGVSQRSHQRHSQAAAARVRDARAGQHGDQAHGAGSRAGRAGRLWRPGHDRRQGAGQVLDQPRHDGATGRRTTWRRWRITSRFRATYGRASTRSSCR